MMGREAACRRSTRPCLILLAAIFSLGFTKTAEALSSSGGGGRSSLRLAGGKCDCQDFGQKGQSLRALVLDRGDACVLVHRLRGGHRTRWDLFKHLLSRYDTDKDSFLSRDELIKMMTDLNHGQAPTVQETSWVMQGCDMGVCNHSRWHISIRELPGVVKIWFRYLEHKELIERVLNQFGSSLPGNEGTIERGLNRTELGAFLASLQGGTYPREDELNSIFDISDVTHDGIINGFELEHIVNIWYTLNGGGDLSGNADKTHSHEEPRMGHLASDIANSWADQRASAMI